MKNFFKAAIFASIFLLIYQNVDSILTYKSTASPLLYLDRLERDSIDVLFLGSSGVYAGVSPCEIWLQEGIPSYALASGVQFPISSYHRLLEFTKRQHPRVIVLEVTGALFPMGSPLPVHQRNYNLLGWKLSLNQVKLLYELFMPSEKILFFNYLTGLPLYHDRYATINRNDFEWHKNYPYGFIPSNKITKIRPPNAAVIAAITEKRKIEDVAEEYLLKMVKYAKENDIPLLFMVSHTDDRTARIYTPGFNYVKEFASKHGCGFINLNVEYKDIGLNYDTDFRDTSHQNVKGAIKTSALLAGILKAKFNLPDRRDEPKYASWAPWAKKVQKTYCDDFNKANPNQAISPPN